MFTEASHWTLLGQNNPVYILTPYLFKISFNIMIYIS